MKHFLKIMYNVFEYHFDSIRFGLVIGGIIAIPFYIFFKDEFGAIMSVLGAILGQIFVAYYREHKRFKERALLIMNTDNFQWNEEAAIEFASYWRNNYPDYSTKELIKAAAEKFKQEKQRKLILVTEDGKAIYEGDAAAALSIDSWKMFTYVASQNVPPVHSAFKYFSSNNVRLHYVIENKPFLSLKEIKASAHLSAIEEQQLVELIKLKI